MTFGATPMYSIKRGFTLVELLVVVGMIAVILGALTTSVQSARMRARVQKATSEVKIVSQAVLAYENFRGELPTMTDADCNRSSLGFLLGDGGSAEQGGQIPVLLQASLSGGGSMMDPWGTPYKITIREGNASLKLKTVTGSMQTGYYLPNFYRVSEGER
ncbi:MAG: prepilin-type N-terminal cleavage/methylation domain-containing protein [Kiritimatiellae bacterium]|nr:prepilin-type N-terminal cleavage/methylation domain-containing protein [Kiritimatiellia bacterium]